MTDLEHMRIAGRLAADTLDYVEQFIVPGVTTQGLSNIAHSYLVEGGGVAATVGYHGFQHALCTSINDEACHGVPSERQLRMGDLLKLDLVVSVDGWHADTARSYVVGLEDMHTILPKEIARKINLCTATREALYQGIFATGKKTVHLVSSSIFVNALRSGARPIERYGGHTIGREMHMQPLIPNVGRLGLEKSVEVLKPGIFIAIEPLLTYGEPWVFTDYDGWTIKTLDGSNVAHFEHTVAILEEGYEVLTLSAKERELYGKTA